ncbi:MAG: hypothetical protein ACREJM_03605, partial [Candidatus Saccharimonadales bacterium]
STEGFMTRAMPHQTRRFESLEHRKLLSVLAAPQAPSASAIAAEIAPGAQLATLAAPANGSDSTSASPDDGSSDDPVEYATASPASAWQAVASPNLSEQPVGGAANNALTSSAPSAYAYASPADGNRYAGDYVPSVSNSTKPPASVPSNDQPAHALAALQPVNSAVGQNTTTSSFAIFSLNPEPAPATAGSPPVVLSPSNEPLGLGFEARAPIAAPRLPPNANGAEALAAPVAEPDSPTDFFGRMAYAAVIAAPFARPGPLILAAEAGARPLLVGAVGVPFATLDNCIDAVFEQFNDLDGGLIEHASGIGQWLVVAAGACAAFEYVRSRYHEEGPWQAASDWRILSEPRLRRRWFHPRSRCR